MTTPTLVAPDPRYADAYRALLAALATAGEPANYAGVLRETGDDFPAFVRWFARLREREWNKAFPNATTLYVGLKGTKPQLGLLRCGAPLRTYLFADLLRDDFPAVHRCFLLPDLFLATPERIALVQAKLGRDANLLIFRPATAPSTCRTPRRPGTTLTWQAYLSPVRLSPTIAHIPPFVIVWSVYRPCCHPILLCEKMSSRQ